MIKRLVGLLGDNPSGSCHGESHRRSKGGGGYCWRKSAVAALCVCVRLWASLPRGYKQVNTNMTRIVVLPSIKGRAKWSIFVAAGRGRAASVVGE
jgi:hypothetical protein